MLMEVVRSEAELDAARALVELFYNPRVFSQLASAPIPGKGLGTRESMPEVYVQVPAAKNTTFGPASVRGPQTFQFTVTAGGSKRLSASNLPTKPTKKPVGPPKWKLNLHKKYQQEQRRWRAECSRRKAAQKRTNDLIAQTEHEKLYRALMDEEKDLSIEIKCITERIDNENENENSPELEDIAELYEDTNISDREVDFTTPNKSTPSKSTRSRRTKISSCCTSSITPPSPKPKTIERKKYKEELSSEGEDENGVDDDEEEHTPFPAKRKSSQSVNVRKINVKTEMVPIGDGHAKVPSRLLKHMNWSSYTGATRKLLSAVFGRKVLATHSLSGKPSPAFPNKPAKERLDADIVNDIVITVRKHCNKVSETHVRAIITTKCADESKMYRSRQQNKQKRRLSKKENFAPGDSTSEESS